MRRTLTTDLATNEVVYTLASDAGGLSGASLARLEEIGLDLGYTLRKRFRIVENDPLSAETALEQAAVLARRAWLIRVECRMRLTATAEMFQIPGDLIAFEAGEQIFRRDWTQAIPRLLV